MARSGPSSARALRTGEKTGEATVATAFTQEDGLVAAVSRHEDLDHALRDVGLEAADEVRAEPRAE